MRISVSHLRAAGLTDTQIIKVFEEADAERREYERIKKRNQRARPRDGGDIGDNGDTALSLSKEEKVYPREESKEEIKKVLKKETRSQKKLKTTLPDDWQPIGNQRDPTEADEFRDHARAKGYQYSDWHAAYRNFQRSPYNARNRNGFQPPDDQAERERQEYFAMQERQREIVNRMTAQGASREEIKRACWSEAVTGKPDANGKSH